MSTGNVSDILRGGRESSSSSIIFIESFCSSSHSIKKKKDLARPQVNIGQKATKRRAQKRRPTGHEKKMKRKKKVTDLDVNMRSQS